MKRKVMTLALTAAMAASMGMTAFAGQWVQNTTGWWWQEDNGSYPVSQWKWLDGNQDGIYECYAFDSNGYIYTNTTTPDGYTVNPDGAWTVGASVQLKFAEAVQNTTNTESDGSYNSDESLYTAELMEGSYITEEIDGVDYYELMPGAGDSIAAIYYDASGNSHVYNFEKVSADTYRDSSHSRTLRIVDPDTIAINGTGYLRQ